MQFLDVVRWKKRRGQREAALAAWQNGSRSAGVKPARVTHPKKIRRPRHVRSHRLHVARLQSALPAVTTSLLFSKSGRASRASGAGRPTIGRATKARNTLQLSVPVTPTGARNPQFVAMAARMPDRIARFCQHQAAEATPEGRHGWLASPMKRTVTVRQFARISLSTPSTRCICN
jgi:hypothetical protein